MTQHPKQSHVDRDAHGFLWGAREAKDMLVVDDEDEVIPTRFDDLDSCADDARKARTQKGNEDFG